MGSISEQIRLPEILLKGIECLSATLEGEVSAIWGGGEPRLLSHSLCTGLTGPSQELRHARLIRNVLLLLFEIRTQTSGVAITLLCMYAFQLRAGVNALLQQPDREQVEGLAAVAIHISSTREAWHLRVL